MKDVHSFMSSETYVQVRQFAEKRAKFYINFAFCNNLSCSRVGEKLSIICMPTPVLNPVPNLLKLLCPLLF